MERIDVLWDAFEDCLCKAELRAEFDRLTAKNEAMESWLNRISEPIREWLRTIPPVSKSWDEHKMGYAFKTVDAIQEYLDSQEPSENKE